MDALTDALNMMLSPQEVALRFLLATLVGGVIGWPRETESKPAGLRTHMLVSLGAASFSLLGEELMLRMGHTFDPLRVLTGVVTGVGFLGAGAIIQSRGSVHGMTTAAGIWLVAGLGSMCGAGAYGMAIICTIFGYIIIVPLDRLKDRFFKNDHKNHKREK